VGPKPPGTDLVTHVLGRFPPEERAAVDRAIPEAVAAIRCLVEEGMASAMNRYNARKRANGTKEDE
jgi:PTH1 family peptidyl-tRNA hydrolase